MKVTRRTSAALLASLLLGFAASPALANGFDRFQREVAPKLGPQTLTFRGGAPAGAEGFVLNDVVVRQPPKSGGPAVEILRMGRLTVDRLDFARLARGEDAHFAKLRAEGLVASPTAEQTATWRNYGLGHRPSTIDLDFGFDAPRQTLTIRRFEAVTPGQGRLLADASLTGLAALTGPPGSNLLQRSSLRSAKLFFDDQSLAAEAVATAADRAGKSREALIAEWLGVLKLFSLGRDTATVSALDALASFLTDYRRPAGPIQITAAPARPVPISVLQTLWLAPDAATAAGLSVSYPGTRRGAASGLR